MSEHAIRRHKPALIVRGETTTLTLTLYDIGTGEPVDLSGAVTGTLKDAAGAIVATGACSISGTGSSVASFTVAGSTTEGRPFDAYWSLEWDVIDVGVYREQAALIRSDVHCPITDQDLLDVAPELYGIQWLDASGDVIPWGRALLASYREFYSRLATVKRWPWKVVNPWAFRSYLIQASLGMTFASLSTDGNTRYAEIAEAHRVRAELEWSRIQVLYDAAEDGSSGSTQVASQPVVYLGGSPSRGRRYW